jgi:hypothetical protein
MLFSFQGWSGSVAVRQVFELISQQWCSASCCDATPLLHIAIFASVTNAEMLTSDNKLKHSGASLLMS